MSPTALTRYTPEKRLSVSPEASLGVFYLWAMQPGGFIGRVSSLSRSLHP